MKRRLFIALTVTLVLLSFCGVGFARIPEPYVTFFGYAKDKGVILTSNTVIVSVSINEDTAPIATYKLGTNADAGGKFILILPMDSVDPRLPGTARPEDRAKFYINGKLSGVYRVPERGTVVHMDADTDFSNDANNDGIPDMWASLYPGNNGSGDMNGNGKTDLQDWLNGDDPAACVWNVVDASHSETCVFNPLVFQNCLKDAEGDRVHNRINLVKGLYTGNFTYTAMSNEDFGLELTGGYEAHCETRYAEAGFTVLDGDNKGITLGLDTGTAGTSGAILVDSISVTNGNGSTGGGISVIAGSGATDIVNAMIYKNTAGAGGGITISTVTGPVTLVNNTIADNSSSAPGAGLSVSIGSEAARVEIVNNIIYRNSLLTGPPSDLIVSGEGVLQVLNNAFGETSGIPVWAASANNIIADPLFVDVAVNNYKLESGSPCIDAGYAAYAEVPLTDFEGDTRGASVDIGADEYRDVTAPSVVISSSAANPTNISPIPVTVTFSEAVTGFTSTGVAVGNGTISGFGGNGTIYTFNVLPVADGVVTVDVSVNAAQDSEGNGNTIAAQLSRTYDSAQPSVTITSAAANPTSISPIPVTVTFSEAVTGFTSTYVMVGNGTISGFGGSGTTYTFNVLPVAGGTVTVDVSANVAQDSAGNGNTAAAQLSRAYDSGQPSVTITSTAANPTNISPIPVTVTFNEAVTGFTSTDVMVGNGTVTGFGGSGTTYTFNVLPVANGAVTVDVAANAAQDSAGNGNTVAAQLSRTYDGIAPNAPSVTGTSPTFDKTPTWSWTSGGSGGNGAYRYQLDGQGGSWTETAATSYTPASPLSIGYHTLYVQEGDDAGNWSAAGYKQIRVNVSAACSWTLNSGIREACVNNAGQLQSCLSDAELDGYENLIKIVQGIYIGLFTYAGDENFDLTLQGGYTAGCAARTINPALTVLDGDIDSDGAGNGVTLDMAMLNENSTGSIIIDGFTVRNGSNTFDDGGCIRLFSDRGRSVVTGNIVHNCTAISGAGIGVQSIAGETMLTNNIVHDNTAALTGGGIGVSTEDGIIVILNNTVAANKATDAIDGTGGGVAVSINSDAGRADIINNIIRGNIVNALFAHSCEDVSIQSDGDGNNNHAIVIFHHNDANTANGVCSTDGSSFMGAGNIDADPLYLNQAAGDYHILYASPCKDAGDSTDPDLTALDVDGQARIQGAAVDMGADEAVAATVQFATASSNSPESVTAASITVTLSAASNQTVTVNYATTNGTATAGSDYTATSGTLTFNPGVTVQTITVPVINDAVIEPDETFTVTLSSPVNAALGATATHTYTISNDDNNGLIVLGAASYTVNEGGATVTITVRRTGSSSGAVGVTYATSNGTATAGSDYTSKTGSLSWPSGNTKDKTFSISIINDSIAEGNETFVIALSNPTGGAALGTPATATVTITDNDAAPTVQFSSSASGGSEAATPAQMTVVLSAASGQTVTVNYATANGTATAGSDYTAASGTLTFSPGETSKTVSVPVINDTSIEGSETFTVTLTSPSNATLGGNTTHTYTITDDDGGSAGTIALSFSVYSVSEGGGTVTITAVRSGGSSGAVGVSYATSNGTAMAGSDYTAASGTLLWANGDTANKTVTIPITNDAINEVNETFTVTLSSPTGGATLGSPSSATVTITDNDAVPTVQFSSATSSGLEATTPAQMTVVLSAASGQTVTVNYATANGTATAGSDYTATSGTLTFSPGETSKTVSVPVINDTTYESNETFTVILSSPVNAVLGKTATHTRTITNDDPKR